MSASSHAVELVHEEPHHRRPNGHALLAPHLEVVREMLGRLDTLTIAGQRHLMEKVVSFLDSRTFAVASHLSNRNGATLFELSARLREESQRLVPDTIRFVRHAENLITLLGVIR